MVAILAILAILAMTLIGVMIIIGLYKKNEGR